MNITLETLGITREELINRIVEALASDAQENCMAEITKQITAGAKAGIEKAINTVIMDVSAKTWDASFTPVDQWGDVKGPPTTVRDLFTKKCSEWWSLRVNTNGEVSNSSYGRDSLPTMAAWHANKAMKEIVDKEFGHQLGALLTEMKTQLAAAFTREIATLVTKTIK